MSDTITAELVSIDADLGADKAAVIRALADRLAAQGRADSGQALFDDAWAREQKDETGLPGGIAIPHAKSASVTTPSLAFARLGYRVKEMLGGYEYWVREGLSVQTATGPTTRPADPLTAPANAAGCAC